MEWWAVSTVYSWARVALQWKWAIHRPYDPPPSRRTASSWGTLNGPTGEAATCQKEPPREWPAPPVAGAGKPDGECLRGCYWAHRGQGAAGAGKGGDGQSLAVRAPTGGRGVKADPPLYLEFMRALTAHFHWIAAKCDAASGWLSSARTCGRAVFLIRRRISAWPKLCLHFYAPCRE